MVDGAQQAAGYWVARQTMNETRVIDLRNAHGQLCGRLYPDTMELEIKPKGGPAVRVELARVLRGPENTGSGVQGGDFEE